MSGDQAQNPAPACDFTAVPIFSPIDGKRLCTLVGCERPYLGLGYCGRHRRRFLLYGDPLAYAPRAPIPTPAQIGAEMRAALAALQEVVG